MSTLEEAHIPSQTLQELVRLNQYSQIGYLKNFLVLLFYISGGLVTSTLIKRYAPKSALGGLETMQMIAIGFLCYRLEKKSTVLTAFGRASPQDKPYCDWLVYLYIFVALACFIGLFLVGFGIASYLDSTDNLSGVLAALPWLAGGTAFLTAVYFLARYLHLKIEVKWMRAVGSGKGPA